MKIKNIILKIGNDIEHKKKLRKLLMKFIINVQRNHNYICFNYNEFKHYDYDYHLKFDNNSSAL